MDCTCRPEHHPGSSARTARPPRACNLHAQSSLSFDLSLSSPPWRTWAPSNLKGFSFCLQTTSLVWSFSPQLVTKSARSHLSLRKAAGNPCKSSGSPRAKATALPVRARFHSFASRLLRIHHRLQTHAPRLRAREKLPTRPTAVSDSAAQARLPPPSAGATQVVRHGVEGRFIAFTLSFTWFQRRFSLFKRALLAAVWARLGASEEHVRPPRTRRCQSNCKKWWHLRSDTTTNTRSARKEFGKPLALQVAGIG